MSILITGADGFIGTHLKKYLRQRGYPVIAPSRDEIDFKNSINVSKLRRS